MTEFCDCGTRLPCISCEIIAGEQHLERYYDRHQERDALQKGSFLRYPANDPFKGMGKGERGPG